MRHFDMSDKEMKTIKVVAAIIKHGDKVFATQRGYGELKGGWEFPGGKIEAGETPRQALIREIKEELDTEIEVNATFHLSMDCYWCTVKHGHLVLLEHEASKWLSAEELNSVEWLPADLILIDQIRKELTHR